MAWTTFVVVGALLVAPRRARAAEEGALGYLVAFALAAGAGIGVLPLAVLRDADAPLSVGFAIGAGRKLDAVALSLDSEGDIDAEGRFTWASRARADFDVDSEADFPEGSMRWETIGSAVFAGTPRGPLTLSGVAGAVVWISAEDRDGNGAIEPFAAVGPAVGLRVDARSRYLQGRIEATYVPLFGEAPTNALHHLDLASTIAVTPWPDAAGNVAFEATLKREIGFADDGIYPGTVLMLGIGIGFDASPYASP